MWRKFLILLSSLNLGPAASYDRSKYELEDRLILRDSHPRMRQHRTGLRQDELDVPIIAAALNYRLPVIPTNTPQLLTNINKNITTYPGGTVVLPCRVLDLGSVSVSWIRTPDLTVLTFGEIMFSSSPRLKLLHSAGSLDWNLQLDSVELEDSGVYECQVNTEPKITRAVYLLVTEEVQERIGRAGHPVPALALQAERVSGERVQRTEILAPDQIRVVEGGSVTLECVVTEHTTPPHFFTWYIDKSPLDFHVHRGGLLLEEERKTKSSASKLTLTSMEMNESGEYTCSPQGADSATVRIVVYQLDNTRRFEYGGSGARYISIQDILVYIITAVCIVNNIDILFR